MPRPRKDGTKARAARHHKLSDIYVRKVKPETMAFAIWDTHQHGLALRVQPTGQKSFKVVYSRHSRANWLHLGDARAIGLADARQLAAKVMLEVATGRDPLAERRAERGSGTFEELATKYVEQHAKRHNKSWKQADALVRRYAIPRWGKLVPKAITRSDVRNLVERIEAPVLANAVLASLSAVFSWAIRQDMVTVNPCKLVDRNPMTSRERILSDGELQKLGVFFPDRRYGELILLLAPGWLLSASGFNGSRWRPAGMHGYHPDDPWSDGVFLSSEPPPQRVTALPDVHTCLHAWAATRDARS